MIKVVKPLLLLFTASLFVFSWASSSAAPMIPAPPQISAKSYLLLDAHSGKVLVQNNATQPLPPASLTKMMTAYIAAHEVNKGTVNLDDQVRISVKAWKTPGSRMFVREGTVVSLEDLLRGIVIQSGNDASVAVAEHVAGSEDAFVDLMNQYARSMGMPNTQYKNATGLPAEGHYTTAEDLGTLAQAITLKHPKHYAMYAEQYFTYNDIRQPNRNKLLWRDKSVDGLKTGHTEEAGFCLVASAQRSGMRLISVVMGTDSEEQRAAESQKLLTYGFRYYETHQLYKAAEELTTVRLWGGAEEQLQLGIEDELYLTIPRGQHGALKANLEIDEFIQAPIKKGTVYGSVNVMLQGELLVQKPLVAMTDVEPGGFFSRLWDRIVMFFLKLI